MPYKFNPFTGTFDEVGVTGTVSAAGSGTAAAPGIAFASDTNTGIFNPAADTLAFAEGGAEAVRIDSSGRLLVGLTSANTSGGILQIASGLTFPATQVASADPNTLDDYEEGTWTPGQGTGVTAVGTFSSTGKYTKIGRIIDYEGAILGTTSVAYNSVGVTSIATGLPFSVAAGGINGTAINNAATAFSFVLATGTSVVGASSIAATTAIYFSGQYIV